MSGSALANLLQWLRGRPLPEWTGLVVAQPPQSIHESSGKIDRFRILDVAARRAALDRQLG
jgi:hypothetical protein